MERYRKIAAVLLLAVTAAGTITLSVFFSRWIVMSAQMEEEDQYRRLDFAITQAINETQDEIRILFPLLTGNISKENIRSAYNVWESTSEYKNLVDSIIYVRSVRNKDIIVYFPETDSYEVNLQNEVLQLLMEAEGHSLEKYLEYMNTLYNAGYILMPVYQGGPVDETQRRPDQLFIISVNQNVLLGDVLRNKIENLLPESGYRISMAGRQMILAQSTIDPGDEPDIVLSLRGNLFQFGALPEYSWEIREGRHLPPDTVSIFSDRRIVTGMRRINDDRSILVDLYLSNDPQFMQIKVKKALSLVFGNSALFLVWGSLLVLTLLYGRSRRLRKQEQEFVSSVSHELRTPLAVILAASDNLSAGVVSDSGKVNTYGNEIKTQALRLNRMVEGVLMYARMGRQTVFNHNPSLIDSERTFNEIIKPVSEILISAGAEFVLRIENIPGQIIADPQALAVILENLIMNAFYHGRPKTGAGLYVETALKLDRNKNLVISVRDNGPGVNRKEIKKIFRPFYRGKDSVEGQHPGSGIGLYILSKVCRSSGGSLELRNRDDGISGAIATVILPVEVPDEQQENTDN